MRHEVDRRALFKAQEYVREKTAEGDVWCVRSNAMNPELYLRNPTYQALSIVASGAEPWNENGKVPVAMFNPSSLTNLHATVHRQVGTMAVRPDS